jgi:hypothetical protein
MAVADRRKRQHGAQRDHFGFRRITESGIGAALIGHGQRGAFSACFTVTGTVRRWRKSRFCRKTHLHATRRSAGSSIVAPAARKVNC